MTSIDSVDRLVDAEVRTVRDHLEADYVIVGGGSSGCVLANRLSADPSVRVLLLEAGGDDRPLHNFPQFFSNLSIYVPAGFMRLLSDRRVIWDYVTEPDPGCGNRVQKYPRGKVLGGSSSINGLVYICGLPSDYDRWLQSGCAGWGWSDVQPLFRRSQNLRGLPPLQGGEGPLCIEDFPDRYSSVDAFLAACAEAGLPNTNILHGEQREGACYTQQTSRDGLRQSTAAAYLHPAGRRSNLRVETNALATRVLFDGRSASGVEYWQHGRRKTAAARREVLLSSGAINSPQLLQLSGVGPAEILRDRGITPLIDRPAVGENLQDHFTVQIQARLRDGASSINADARGFPLIRQILQFVTKRRGLLSQSIVAATGYLRSSPRLLLPDVQFSAVPATMDFLQTAARGRAMLEREPGFTLGGYVMQPTSRGSVIIRSPKPVDSPVIRLNFLSTPEDERSVVAMVQALRRLLRQPSMDRIIDRELPPFGSVNNEEVHEILTQSRATGFTGYHPVGTCRMGADADSVTDPQLKVRGIGRLRIVDASIMPDLVSANTNAACIMIGEKAADLIIATQ